MNRKMKSANSSGVAVISAPVLLLNQGEKLAITGSVSVLGNWTEAVVMDDSVPPYAHVEVVSSEPFEYKYVVVDEKSGCIRRWEDGSNRFSGAVLHSGAKTYIRDDAPRLSYPLWRSAGVAIPVFSLRTKKSFGIGEFTDLCRMVDWAVLTGQKIIQLLPINDTTMTGTWEDSYPYNANSTFALHPQFIDLLKAGVADDEEYRRLQEELNSLPQVDYERVNNEKNRLMLKAFDRDGKKVAATKKYKSFICDNKEWLMPYAAFRCLTEEYGTPDFSKWGSFAKYDAEAVDAYCRKNRKKTDFHCFVQYHLDSQMKEAREYAKSRGVMLKGDLPIGISRTSVDAWRYPTLFNMNSQAGAPPDAFSADGQNWGFPTYNWDRMSKDGYAWWKSRLKKMSDYFDAFRIDHILGFFRIWEIPLKYKSGLMGHFNPALPYSEAELRENGLDVSGGGFVKSGNNDPSNVLFIKDPTRKGYWHPRIGAQGTACYGALEQWQKDAYNRLYDDFFYRRHNRFWKESAYRKLPELLSSTDMLACGEDLGMIPDCVPETMNELKILSLEIQRMPKSVYETFANPANYPYLSVCTTSTHDMNPLRSWWEEDRELTGRYYREVLGGFGDVPYFCEPWVCRKIVADHLASPSMFAILPLQDWLSMDGRLRRENPDEERINIPAISRHYWRYRMHISLDDLLEERDFNRMVCDMVQSSGR